MRPGMLVVAAVLALPALSPAVIAQVPASADAAGEEEVVDRVVAVVGDSAIFYSEVEDDIRQRRAAGLPVPERADSAAFDAFARQVLDEAVNRTLVLNAAVEDTTVTVLPEQIEERFDVMWEDLSRGFGSEAELRRAVEATGLTLAQYRALRRREIEEGLLLETYLQSQRQASRMIPVEEAEIREFFEREREAAGNLGERPSTLTFEHVVIAPQPSDSVRATAREEAREVLGLLDEGEDFGELAQRFSDDPGSGQRGGELGWIRRGAGFVQEFEDAVFRLGREQVSDVVETQFGAHIIQVQRINGAERMVRHILIGAEPTDTDVEAARERARAIREEVESGVPVSDFAEEGQDTGILNPATLTMDQLGQLPPSLAQALRTASQGDVLGPIEIEAGPGESAFAVAHVSEVREAGEITYEDVRDQIRTILQDRQFQDRLIERLRSEMYVEIRM